MANIQEDVTKQIWDLFLKFFGTGTEFVYQIAHEGNVALKQGGNFCNEFILALINKNKQNGEPTDVLTQMLKREEAGESVNTMAVAEEDAEVLSSYLKEKGILYHVVDNPQDDTKFFMYMSNDAEKVMDVVSVFQAEKGYISELNPELFLENFAQDGVGTISGLDKVDLEVFRNFAKENNLIFSSTFSNESNKYIVIYDPENIDKVRKVMDSTVWALTGSAGLLLREQMERYLQNRQEINKTLLNAEKEFYIINGNAPENYVHLTANEFVYYKNSKEILTVDRNDGDFMERGIRVFSGMTRPVLLTREEYERFLKDGEIDKDAIKKFVSEKAKDLPHLEALIKAQKEQNDKLERLQSKMALDDENTAGFWIYDDSIDFAAGGEYEGLEDIDEQTKEDIADAQRKAEQYKFLQVENRDIDYLISKAENHRKQASQEKREPEKETVIE